MADQNKVLKLLAAAPAPLSIDALQKGMRRGGFAIPPRKAIIVTLGRLMERKFAERADAKTFGEKQRANWRNEAAHFEATKAGRDFICAGKRITDGPYRPRTAPTRALPNTVRQKIWNAFRISKKATLGDLAEAAAPAGADAGKTVENARKYLKGLCKAGIVVELQVRAPGHSLTSNGFKRFSLVLDLGPRAPVVSRAGVFDPNKRETIPYAVAKR